MTPLRTGCAGLPGHAFVVRGKDDEQKQLCSVEAHGFYPKTGKGVFGPVSSEIANEAPKNSGPRLCLLIVKVDQAQFEEAEAIRRKWSEQGDFQLAKRDCVSFSDAVAESLNLMRPKRVATRRNSVSISGFSRVMPRTVTC
jgi:hypothetical protein